MPRKKIKITFLVHNFANLSPLHVILLQKVIHVLFVSLGTKKYLKIENELCGPFVV